jgi:hypothetical protein
MHADDVNTRFDGIDLITFWQRAIELISFFAAKNIQPLPSAFATPTAHKTANTKSRSHWQQGRPPVATMTF